MVVTSFSCTSCCFFFFSWFPGLSMPFFHPQLQYYLLGFSYVQCAIISVCLLSDALLSGYKLHHHLWSWQNSWCLPIQIWSAWCRHECSAIFACSMNVVHIYAIFSEAQCVLIRIKKSTKMWTKPWCGTSVVHLTQVHILLGWDPRMKLTVTSLLQQLGWGYHWAAALRTRAEVSVEEELLDQLRWFLKWDPFL
jgi:hypothetical protein